MTKRQNLGFEIGSSSRLLSYLEKGIVLLEIILLIIFLYWHYKLGLFRYFDADEITHIHWGYSFYIGERPYTDFFYLFPPFFLYPIASLFAIFGRSLIVLTAARIFVFFVFTSMVLILFLIGRKLRGSLVGLTTVVIFAFLPLPSDKMIEVRPDLLATLLSLLGLYLFIEGEERKKRGYFFLSGLFYSLSLGFVPKTVFFLIPPLIVLFYKFFSSISSTPGESLRATPGVSPRLNRGHPRGVLWLKSLKWFKREGSLFILGFLPPAIVLLLLIFSFGNPSFALYCMTRMASSITAVLGKKFYMRPDIFFYQNDTYYGLPGYSLPYVVNLVIYLSASIFAIFRFVQSLSFPDSKKCLREFLVGAAFFANLYAHVFVYPLKHAQYLIPVVPFIAFYFADFLDCLLLRSTYLIPSHRESRFATLPVCLWRILVFVLTLFLLGWTGRQMYGKKMQFRDKPMFDRTVALLEAVPRDAAVFDLTGESIFFPNGYYFCCLPYGQYEEALGFDLPNLEHDLEKRNTKYVYTGSPDRLDVLPPLQAKYIKDNFIPYFPDGSLLIKK